MNVESFLICDAATDSNGKLNVLGAFDTIFVNSLPAIHPMCSVVIRIRGKSDDNSEHEITVIGNDDTGKSIVPKFEAKFVVQPTVGAPSSVVNFILNLQQVKIESMGEYTFTLRIDNQLSGRIPLFVKPVPNQTPVK